MTNKKRKGGSERGSRKRFQFRLKWGVDRADTKSGPNAHIVRKCKQFSVDERDADSDGRTLGVRKRDKVREGAEG